MADNLIFLTPHITHNIWGGNRLRTIFGYDVEGDDLGEAWGVAAHPHGASVVRDGVFQGSTLLTLWRDHPELFGKTAAEPADTLFPILIKLIDAKDDLSIQVHPDDAYASAHENGAFGKTECWYILDCGEDASLVLGHHAQTREELHHMIDTGAWDQLICEVPVQKGDFIFLPPGTLHAIKGGILLLEVQQNSDITYRVYDYDRLWDGKKRELHLTQSKDVITVPAGDLAAQILHDGEGDDLKRLSACAYFTLDRIRMDGRTEVHLPLQPETYALFCVLDGEGSANGAAAKKGDFILIPAGNDTLRLTGALTCALVREV